MSPFFAVLPPIVVLALGIATRRIISSMIAGIILSAIIAKNFSLVEGGKYALQRIMANADAQSLISMSNFLASDSLCISFFLLVLGTLITAIQETGGAFAFTTFIKRCLKRPKLIEGSSIFLSIFFFIDDYFSSLTVGSVMGGIISTYRIARAKLAFLVDTLAAPLAILCPFSGWVAAFMGFLMDSGVNIDGSDTHHTLILGSPFAIYIESIPYIFYSFIALFSCVFISAFGISYGPMRKEEEAARTLQQRSTTSNEDIRSESAHANAAIGDFAWPILVLIFGVFFAMLYTGNHLIFGGKNDLLAALHSARGSLGLFLGGSLSLVFSLSLFLVRKKITPTRLPGLIKEGIVVMLPAIYVLILSWTLGDLMSNDLHTGQVIADYCVGAMSPALIPMMFFVTAFVIAFSIGSSWGTMAIMFPIMVNFLLSLENVSPVQMHDLIFLCPTVGAILSGCICGDHLSPISNTSILSASSCQITPAKHFETQIWYGIPMVISAMIAYWIIGDAIHTQTTNGFGKACFVSIISLISMFTLGHWGHRLLADKKQALSYSSISS